MINDDNEMLPVLIMNAAACHAGIIDRETFEALSRDIPRPVTQHEPPTPNEMQAVLDMNDAALTLKIINPTQHAQFRRNIVFRQDRDNAARQAAKRGARRIVL